MSHQQPRPQAVRVADVDSEDRDDGPNPMGIALIAALTSALIFGAGIYVGFTANVDRWYAALKGVGL